MGPMNVQENTENKTKIFSFAFAGWAIPLTWMSILDPEGLVYHHHCLTSCPSQLIVTTWHVLEPLHCAPCETSVLLSASDGRRFIGRKPSTFPPVWKKPQIETDQRSILPALVFKFKSGGKRQRFCAMSCLAGHCFSERNLFKCLPMPMVPYAHDCLPVAKVALEMLMKFSYTNIKKQQSIQSGRE